MSSVAPLPAGAVGHAPTVRERQADQRNLEIADVDVGVHGQSANEREIRLVPAPVQSEMLCCPGGACREWRVDSGPNTARLAQ